MCTRWWKWYIIFAWTCHTWKKQHLGNWLLAAHLNSMQVLEVLQWWRLTAPTNKKGKKNAIYRWQWALPVTSIVPHLFTDVIFSQGVVNNKYIQMVMWLYMGQCQLEKNTTRRDNISKDKELGMPNSHNYVHVLTNWITTATRIPPLLSYAAGKLSKPAPRAALTTRNTDAYQEEP